MTFLRILCLAIACACLVLVPSGVLLSATTLWQLSAVLGSVTLAIGLGALPQLAGYQFTAWILAAVTSAMIYPSYFLQWGPFRLGDWQLPTIDWQNKWLILIVVQLVMFGMGTKMSIKDFAGVVRMPYPVLIGISLQFLVMPLSGYTLARVFAFPPEIAAGVVLIGSCSSGLASNVMCYLAGANLPLSITLTSVATLLAPLATPFWMKQLAGEFVAVDALAMMSQIAKIVLVPVGAAMLHDYLNNVDERRKAQVVKGALSMAAVFLLAGGAAVYQPDQTPPLSLPGSIVEALFIVGGALVFAVGYHYAAGRWQWVENNMHLLSMFGILYFTAVTTAAGRESLLVCGFALVVAALLHNVAGYCLGYTLSRLAGLDKNMALTVGFEVGMQNGGMASSLAAFMGKLGTVGLAAAVFSPLMNVTGSVLANQVRRRRERTSVE